MPCQICDALAGKSATPRYVIADGQYWQLEHAAVTSLPGWLRLIMKRHVEALDELTPDELAELGTLLGRTTKALKKELNCEKEYLMCFSEGEGTRHIHVHIVAKPADLPDDQKGAKVFARLNVPAQQALSAQTIHSLVNQLS